MSIKVIAQNRKARFNYDILDSFEAGVVLLAPRSSRFEPGN